MKKYLKYLLAILAIFIIIYLIILALTYYQYNFNKEFKDRKPISNTQNIFTWNIINKDK